MTGPPADTDLKTRLFDQVPLELPDLVDNVTELRDGRLSPNDVAQLVSYLFCEQYYGYRIGDAVTDDREQTKPAWKEAFQPLDPLMEKTGRLFEEDITEELFGLGSRVRNLDDVDSKFEAQRHFLDAIADVYTDDPGDAPLILQELRLWGALGVWEVAGDADYVVLWREDDGVHIRVIDMKATHEEKTYHRTQVAHYTLLIRQFLQAVGLRDDFDIDYTITGGVLEQSADLNTLPDDLPVFEPDVGSTDDVADDALTRQETDVLRLLGADGVLADYDDKDSTEYEIQLGEKCHNCPYREACFTFAVEDLSTEMLGLSPREQDALAEHDIHTIEDVAQLAYPPDDPRPYEQGEDSTLRYQQNNDAVDALRGDPQIGPQMSELVQRAQVMLGTLNPAHPHAFAANDTVPWLIGAGDGNLPEDDPISDYADVPMPNGEMIRVYLHVQFDHRYERVPMVSGYVTSSEYLDAGHDPIQFSHFINEDDNGWLPENDAEWDDLEYEVLRDTVDDIFGAMETIREEHESDQVYPHFYVYGGKEIEEFVEALKRYEDEDDELAAVRDLLGLDAAVDVRDYDQPMVSVVQTELRDRVALPTPNPGLLPAMDEFFPYNEAVTNAAWTYHRNDGTEVDLRDAFDHQFFDFRAPYTEARTQYQDVSPDADYEFVYGQSVDDVSFYPIRVRSAAQIPLPYMWVAAGRIDDDWVADLDERGIEGNPDYFRFHDQGRQDSRITHEDVMALGERLAHGVAHVERSLEYRNSSLSEAKSGFTVDELRSFSEGEPSLSLACEQLIEYEYEASKEETESHLALPFRQRIRKGETIPMHVASTTVANTDDGWVIRVRGNLLHDQLFDDDVSAQQMMFGTNKQEGDYMVATSVDARRGRPAGDDTPLEIRHGPKAEITQFNPDADIKGASDMSFDPDVTPQIELELRERFTRGSRYRFAHNDWAAPPRIPEDSIDAETGPAAADPDAWPPGYDVDFSEDAMVLLDPGMDDINSQKTLDMLDAADYNPTLQLFEAMRSGTRTTPTVSSYPVDAVSEYLNWVDANFPIAPNEKQAAFIKETDAKISLLQGPPGTGKTSGSMSHAALSRCYAASQTNQNVNGVVSGTSNKAVREMLVKVAKHLSLYDGPSMGDVKLVRLNGTGEPHPDIREAAIEDDVNGDDPADWLNLIEFVSIYQTPGEFEKVLNRVETAADQSQGQFDGLHTLLFTTPSRFYNFMNKTASVYSPDGERWYPEDLREHGYGEFFNLLVVDEASMMQLPEFFLLGAFLTRESQILVGGDQRQMPPVLQHNWEDETRRIVEWTVPYLSVLDYCRFLRGDKLELIDLEDAQPQPDCDIPLTQLERTYRCHETVTDFLHRHMYRRDDLPYTSDEDDTFEAVDAPTDGLETLLDPDAPLTLLLHDESSSYKSNTLERALSEAVKESIDTDALDGGMDALMEQLGIVTPHTAQRGAVTRALRRHDDVDAEDADELPVDTVERFQGGEQRLILVSATASDPDFLQSESDFILNPNRLNVALSRMEEKAVVMASREVFNLMPKDIEKYDRARLWKGLYRDLGVNNREADWSGTAEEFVAGTRAEDSLTYHDSDVSIEVYTLQEDDAVPVETWDAVTGNAADD